MFYLENLKSWLKEIVRKCKERGLNPEEAVFMFTLFSSLDRDFVAFFKENYDQISSYSGENFHILTPLIYANEVVSDEEVRKVRREFSTQGIRVSNRPSILMFKLQRSGESYKPYFFAGYELSAFEKFSTTLRDLIDSTLDAERDFDLIASKFSELLGAKNLIPTPLSPNNEISRTIEETVPNSRVFISHASSDKSFVKDLMKELTEQKT